ncbi:DUF998 domain-containing protein [Mycobacterium kubicae]|nr:DUF998 domain-containing protein [Mycobacterium kubicae]
MPPRRTAGAIAWIAAASGFLILEAMSAHAVPAYSYVHDYISSLGVPARSPRAGMMNAAFAVQGVLLLLGALLLAGASRHTRLFVGLVALNTVGNVVVAAVHSGSPLHGWGALLAIAGGNAAILAGARCVPQLFEARWYRVLSQCVAALGFVGLVLFVVGASGRTSVPWVGIWERLSVYSILLWQALSAVFALLSAGRGD